MYVCMYKHVRVSVSKYGCMYVCMYVLNASYCMEQNMYLYT